MSSDLAHILRDPSVRDDILAAVESEDGTKLTAKAAHPAKSILKEIESVASGAETSISFMAEAIIRRTGRPVLYIQDDAISQAEQDKKLKLPIWKARFAKGLGNLSPNIPSVGRIELRGHPRYSWVGTGWLVAPRIMVTNRHVAELFARKSNDGYAFKVNPRGRDIRAWVDTYEEHERTAETEYRIQKVLHIEEDPGPDIAFLRVAPTDSTNDRDLPKVIDLSENDPGPGDAIAAIGYAGWDGDRNERAIMDQIFESTYEVKRLHPGEVMDVSGGLMTHDCSTLGGNSGSVLLDFDTGKAVGLHFAGQFEKRNYAVPASIVTDRLKTLLSSGV